MKSTFRVLFFLKRDKVKKNGNMPIMARVTIDGKLAQFNTKLEVCQDRKGKWQRGGIYPHE